jgi:hypothetical protein
MPLNDDPTPPVNPPEGGVKTSLATILSFTQGAVPLVVAIIILVYFGTVIKQMFGLTGPSVGEIQWGRNAYLYGGVEALAYAAAGFLFGREVNRQRAEKAEQTADRALQETGVAQRVAAHSVANGRALAEGVRALENVQSERRVASLDAASGSERTEIRMLRGMADRFFPPSAGKV